MICYFEGYYWYYDLLLRMVVRVLLLDNTATLGVLGAAGRGYSDVTACRGFIMQVWGAESAD